MQEALDYNEWIAILEEKAEGLPKYQARFSNFEVLPRLGKLLSIKSKTCTECKMYWSKIQVATEHLDKFFDDGNTYSRDFDLLVKEIFNHLKDHHQIRPKGFILSMFALSGMVLGVLLGVLIGYLFFDGVLKGGIVLGWLLGMMIGWFMGKVKEEKMRKQHLLF
ncbi:hypothetical protein E9993_11585 [Labilibacter sediminis]|nr:hypothetical protein E9993_11585 [Labilibacter sediminis]